MDGGGVDVRLQLVAVWVEMGVRAAGAGLSALSAICYVTAMESRIVALEVRYTHLERLVDELSQVVFAQQKVIDRLSAEVTLLRSNLSGSNAPSERPPHY